MTRYIALLRGINVGRNNRVAMADLRRLLADLGATDVATHLQSGNAVFTSSTGADQLATRLRTALAKELDVNAAVMVRTAAELAAAMDADPLGDVASDPKRHLLGFFSAAPAKAKVAELEESVRNRLAESGTPPEKSDQFQILRDHLYLWCAVNVHESLFATVKWDKVLGVEVTMRNWATVAKLRDLSGG